MLDVKGRPDWIVQFLAEMLLNGRLVSHKQVFDTWRDTCKDTTDIRAIAKEEFWVMSLHNGLLREMINERLNAYDTYYNETTRPKP